MINNFIAFKGCAPEYKRNGMTIKPISKNPSEDEINEAVAVAENNNGFAPKKIGIAYFFGQSTPVYAHYNGKAGAGMNGTTYFLGQDLVIKKFNSSEAYDRETKALDLIYEDKINIPNSQKGVYAFKTNNASYLVSTRVSGASPDPAFNKFNTDNLGSILDIMFEMDKPVLEKFDPNKKEKVNFPFKNPMHWDLSIDNIMINKENAGLVDFEYLDYHDHNHLLNVFTEQKRMPFTASSYDIPGIMLNINGFESRALYVYLSKADKDVAVKTFDKYLNLKSDYHQKRYQMFSDMESADNKVQEQIDRMTRSELAHSRILKNPSKSVKEAEAIKMQMNRWIFKQSGAEISTEDKINPKQIKKYIKDADEFFNYKKEHSKTSDEYIYFDDCCKLSKGWQEFSEFIDYRMKPLPPLEDIYCSINGKKVPFNEAPEDFKKYIENNRKRCKLFQKKLTDEKTETLDKKVCY